VDIIQTVSTEWLRRRAISAASNAANAGGDFGTAVTLMEQFLTEIKSLYNRGVLPQADFNALNDAASIIIAKLTSPFTSFTG